MLGRIAARDGVRGEVQHTEIRDGSSITRRAVALKPASSMTSGAGERPHHGARLDRRVRQARESPRNPLGAAVVRDARLRSVRRRSSGVYTGSEITATRVRAGRAAAGRMASASDGAAASTNRSIEYFARSAVGMGNAANGRPFKGPSGRISSVWLHAVKSCLTTARKAGSSCRRSAGALLLDEAVDEVLQRAAARQRAMSQLGSRQQPGMRALIADEVRQHGGVFRQRRLHVLDAARGSRAGSLRWTPRGRACADFEPRMGFVDQPPQSRASRRRPTLPRACAVRGPSAAPSVRLAQRVRRRVARRGRRRAHAPGDPPAIARASLRRRGTPSRSPPDPRRALARSISMRAS